MRRPSSCPTARAPGSGKRRRMPSRSGPPAGLTAGEVSQLRSRPALSLAGEPARSCLADEPARYDLDGSFPEFRDRLRQVLGEAAEDLLALLWGGAERIADNAMIGHLVVIHGEVEVLVSLELRVPGRVALL